MQTIQLIKCKCGAPFEASDSAIFCRRCRLLRETKTLRSGFAVVRYDGFKLSVRAPLRVIKLGNILHLVSPELDLDLQLINNGGKLHYLLSDGSRELLSQGLVATMPRIPFINKLLGQHTE